mmetsp:Transcript_5165/g.12182  ORF Transcript_5165/g.12182 Transcript_5165/m.12182 type:complete len:262 (+) Transcript_5165:574-1359(+)
MHFNVFCIDLAAAVNVPQSHLQIGVERKYFFLATKGDGFPHDFSGSVQPHLANLELCIHLPQLTEAEFLVRNQFGGSFVDSTGSVGVSNCQLLEKTVVDPQVYVPPPVPLLCHWRSRSHSTLVHFSYPFNVPAGFFQADIVKPNVVASHVFFECFLVLESSLVHHNIFDHVALPTLFFECNIQSIELFGLPFRQFVQRRLVDCSCSVNFSLLFFKLCEPDIKFLIDFLVIQNLDRFFEAGSGAVHSSLPLLELAQTPKRSR